MKSGAEKPKESYDDDLTRGFGERLREMLQSIKPDGFLEKPVDPDVMVAKIKELLH